MCLCRPEVKTPFCGRPGCEWPDQVVASESPAVNLTLMQWVTERMDNCERIARTKIGSEHRGWLQDAAHFRHILRALRTRSDYGLRCQRCQAPRNIDTSVPSAIWNQLVNRREGKDDDWDLLCTLCIDELAAEKGLTCEVEFYFVGASIRSKLYVIGRGALRARIRDLERAISAMLDVRGDAVKALRRIAAL